MKKTLAILIVAIFAVGFATSSYANLLRNKKGGADAAKAKATVQPTVDKTKKDAVKVMPKKEETAKKVEAVKKDTEKKASDTTKKLEDATKKW